MKVFTYIYIYIKISSQWMSLQANCTVFQCRLEYLSNQLHLYSPFITLKKLLSNLPDYIEIIQLSQLFYHFITFFRNRFSSFSFFCWFHRFRFFLTTFLFTTGLFEMLRFVVKKKDKIIKSSTKFKQKVHIFIYSNLQSSRQTRLPSACSFVKN